MLTDSQSTPETRLSFRQRTAPAEDACETLRGALDADVIVTAEGMAGLGLRLLMRAAEVSRHA